ncbi:hypothetical protein XFF6990_200190 [Xanthomonas citri pv. fuscans]|nr:hypothetical protein XFF6990_200190 [Xanthomonas citri pv. fuscans]
MREQRALKPLSCRGEKARIARHWRACLGAPALPARAGARSGVGMGVRGQALVPFQLHMPSRVPSSAPAGHLLPTGEGKLQKTRLLTNPNSRLPNPSLHAPGPVRLRPHHHHLRQLWPFPAQGGNAGAGCGGEMAGGAMGVGIPDGRGACSGTAREGDATGL